MRPPSEVPNAGLAYDGGGLLGLGVRTDSPVSAELMRAQTAAQASSLPALAANVSVPPTGGVSVPSSSGRHQLIGFDGRPLSGRRCFPLSKHTGLIGPIR